MMSSTPDSTNTSTKLSPFGNRINRSLLTPCRRLGLSRKRSTPLSIAKTASDETDKDPIDSVSQTTPVNINKSVKRKESKVCIKKTTNLTKTFEKKKLDKHFSNDSISENVHFDDKCSLKTSNNDDEIEIAKPLHTIESQNEDVLSNSSFGFDIKEEPENIVSVNTRISNMISDSDDDIPLNAKVVKKPENVNSSKNKKKSLIKSQVISKSEEMLEDLRECKISLKKLSNEDINSIQKHDSSDDDTIRKIKKRRMVIQSDDESDFCSVPKISKIPNTDCKLKENKKSKLNSPKIKNKKDIHCSTIVSQDEDDDFTSTPDQDRVQRKELMLKVTTLEAQVKEKRKKLEDLKQASVYKKKHNIDDLVKQVGIWKEGCVLGLNSLLTQLQSHGPIDMPILLNNLHISDETVRKLCLDIPKN